jgi:hypothetical protein
MPSCCGCLSVGWPAHAAAGGVHTNNIHQRYKYKVSSCQQGHMLLKHWQASCVCLVGVGLHRSCWRPVRNASADSNGLLVSCVSCVCLCLAGRVCLVGTCMHTQQLTACKVCHNKVRTAVGCWVCVSCVCLCLVGCVCLLTGLHTQQLAACKQTKYKEWLAAACQALAVNCMCLAVRSSCLVGAGLHTQQLAACKRIP